MVRLTLESLIDKVLFFYILSLYLFTFREGYNDISNIIAIVLVLIILIDLVMSKKKIYFNSFLLVYLLFIFFCIGSYIYAIDKVLVFNKVKTLISIYVVMVLLTNYIISYEKIDKILKYFIYSGVFASVYIIKNVDLSVISRYGDVLGNQNQMALIIGVSVMLCLYMVINKKKYGYIILMIIMVPTILLTGSRKGILFIGFNLIFLIYLDNRKKIKERLKSILLIIGLIGIIIYLVYNVPIFYEILGTRIDDLILSIGGQNVNDESIKMRSYMVTMGLNFFGEKPFWGYGIDNYRVLLGSNIGEFTYAHNNYVELLVGIGIPGCMLYYLTHLILIKQMLISIKICKNKTIYYMFLGIIISLMFLSTGMVYYDDKQFSFMLALMSGLGSCETKIRK